MEDKKHKKVEKKAVCPACKGTGMKDEDKSCDTCHGSGLAK